MITVLHERWRASPLVWIHRGEARALAAELRAEGRPVRLAEYAGVADAHAGGAVLLRLSDPAMWNAAQAFTRAGIPYLGPGAQAMARCYDKYAAYGELQAAGIDCPATALACDQVDRAAPFILKARRGSDSIGLKLIRGGAVPHSRRTQDYLVQEHVRGIELTVAVIGAHAGVPLRIVLPEGTPYSFARKYLLPARKVPVSEELLIERVRGTALHIARLLRVDWSVRVDFIYDARSARLCFLECDAAPLIGAGSAFALSCAAAGMARKRQLRLLLNEER